jgi:alkanesulfonate monooxygenase SsuD/methylene tetrahydromethanopterin reductase-like flavin-dependent oxidoreductase (luciferase family)
MGQVGALAESPLTLLREYTAALYALLHGETVTVHGQYVSLDEVKLDWPPAVPPPLLVGGVKPRTVALAGELADGVIISSGPSPDEIRATAAHFRASRPDGAAAGDIVVFTRASADSPARDIAARVSEFAAAGATHVAVNADERDADLKRFVTLLAREVSPLVRSG